MLLFSIICTIDTSGQHIYPQTYTLYLLLGCNSVFLSLIFTPWMQFSVSKPLILNILLGVLVNIAETGTPLLVDTHTMFIFHSLGVLSSYGPNSPTY